MPNYWRNSFKSKCDILPVVNRHQTLIVFDTETTGLTDEAKIIQFSGILYSISGDFQLTELEEMDVYINPNEPIPDKIITLTGIDDLLVANCPNEQTLAPQIFEFLAKSNLWVGYNIPFDIRQLANMAQRTGYNLMYPQTLDVLPMARDLISKDDVPKHNLETITKFLFPEDDTCFHSSIEDVKATSRCLSTFIKMYEQVEYKPGIKVHLEWASYWENPHSQSQKRIGLCLDKSRENVGDIFWDVRNHCWSCKSTPSAKKLFSTIDLMDLEDQVLTMYGAKHMASTMDQLADSMRKKKQP